MRFILGNTTIGALIGLDGLKAPVTIKGAMTSDHFVSYLEQFVVPQLPAGSVLILDNLSAHKRSNARQVLLKNHIRLVFLPPYAHHLNPIEHCWSKVKEHLRAAARSVEALDQAIAAALDHLGRHCRMVQACWLYHRLTCKPL